MGAGNPDLRVVANDVVGGVAAGVVCERLPGRAALWLSGVEVERAQRRVRRARRAHVRPGHDGLGLGRGRAGHGLRERDKRDKAGGEGCLHLGCFGGDVFVW